MGESWVVAITRGELGVRGKKKKWRGKTHWIQIPGIERASVFEDFVETFLDSG